MKGELNRLLEDPKYRKEFGRKYDFFKLEVQILLAMEEKGWSYEDLAKAAGTSRQNIWRDLKNGGLHKASLDRLVRIVEALGLRFHAFIFNSKQQKILLPKIKKVLIKTN